MPRWIRVCFCIGAAAALALSAGCDVQPYCVGGICADAAPADGTDGRDGAAEGDVGDDDAATPSDVDAADAGDAGDTGGEADAACPEGTDFMTDPANCGFCGNRCRPDHAFGQCVDGECVVRECDVTFFDCDGDYSTGCERYCVPTLPGPCDSTCVPGIPGAECDTSCNNRDDDCNCVKDDCVDKMTDPDNCGACGRRCFFPNADGLCVDGDCVVGTCHCGYRDVSPTAPGCEYECGPTDCSEPPAESCNGFDDDCDGLTDEDDPGGGAACGWDPEHPEWWDAGECEAGAERCIDSRIQCVGGTAPIAELCNGRDDDCDGDTDEDDPEGGASCGTTTGDCDLGVTRCDAGAIVCDGEVLPATEACNGHDDDCDGAIDELPLTLAITCTPPPAGICVAGTPACVGGTEMCAGEIPGTPELCNRADDDCDGLTDEDFDLDSDPRRCGSCTNVCALPNVSTSTCVGGVCSVGACGSGYWDIDRDPANGCEYRCDYRGAETCNGQDDDCDTLADGDDPDMAASRPSPGAPHYFCNTTGACSTATVACGLSGGSIRWYCVYTPPVVVDPGTGAIQPETLCNAIDEDCDGTTDENWPGVRHGISDPADACSAGIGACLRTGAYACTADMLSQACSAVAGPPGTEACNGLDDDCNGSTDDFLETNYAAWGAVQITGRVDTNRDGSRDTDRTFYVMQYEASRPDATGSAGGTISSQKVCSRTGVIPWTDVTWTQARDACCRLNTGGTCRMSGSFPQGWSLCRSYDWRLGCELSGATTYYTYPYGNTYAANTCNGNDYDTDGGTAGDQDGILATGFMTNCRNATAFPPSSSRILDASGNVKEWTWTSRTVGTSTYYEIRGGASNNSSSGLTCPFDFTLGSATFSFPNLGFRCCYYPP